MQTATPLLAKSGSTDAAAAAGRAEKARRAHCFGRVGQHGHLAAQAGMGVGRSRTGMRIALPAARSDPVRATTLNQGCPSRSCTKRCPTAPGAPSTATGMGSCGELGKVGGRVVRLLGHALISWGV